MGEKKFSDIEKKKKISFTFYIVMIVFGEIKFLRRKMIINRQK